MHPRQLLAGLLLPLVGAVCAEDVEIRKLTYTYKEVDGCKIEADVYRLSGDGQRPALVWIHGGALILGDRGMIEREVLKDYLERYLEAGFTVISIGYRLAPETKLTEIIEDIRDAFRWIRQKGPREFGIDPERIAVTGGSAGGYLTLMTGFCIEPRPKVLVSHYGYGDIVGKWYTEPCPFYLTEERVSKDRADSAVRDSPIAGCRFDSELGRKRLDFYVYCRQNGLWCQEVVGFDPIKEPEKFIRFCPVQNVTKEYPPTMLLHGDQDTDVPYEQSVMMANELERWGIVYDLRILKGQGHGFEFVFENDDFKKNDDPQVAEAFEAAIAFLKKHIGDE